MADGYIKRSDALQFVFDACTECMEACEEFDGIHADCHQCLLEGVKLKLRDIPAADVVPVVRCKDCVYYDTVGCTDGFGWCEGTMVNTGTHDNFFCAEGKKKEEA